MASDDLERWRLLRRAVDERKYLLAIHDVLGYGVGYRESRGQRTDQPALVVYVRPGRKALDPKDVPPHQRIPTRVRLNVEGEWVWLPVDLIETEPGRLQEGALPVGDLRRLVSLGHQTQLQRTGSVGWIARQAGPGGERVVCTAFHALLSMKDPHLQGSADKRYSLDLAKLDRVLQPSREDAGDESDDVFGFVIDGRRSNLVDVGVVLVTDQAWLEETVQRLEEARSGPLGPPRFLIDEQAAVSANPTVSLLGRTSGPVRGSILEFPAVHTFPYEDGSRSLFQLIATDISTLPGDSGALLVDLDRRPLGLLLGSAGGRSFFMNIKSVIEQLNLIPA